MEPIDLEEFKKHGIKCILDLRSVADYQQANGSKVLDNYYKLYKVILPKSFRYKPHEDVICQAVDKSKKQNVQTKAKDITGQKHFLINFFTSEYTSTVFKRAPWYIQFISIFIALFDFVFKTGFKNFVRLFAVTVINREGLTAGYTDVVEMSKPGLCAGRFLNTFPHSVSRAINLLSCLQWATK